MYGRQYYRGEQIESPHAMLARYHIEELYREADQSRLVRAARAGQARARSQAKAAARPRLLSRTRLAVGLLCGLIGVAALAPDGPGSRIAPPALHAAAARDSLAPHGRLPAACAVLGDGHGQFPWPPVACGGAQVTLRSGGFGNHGYVFLYLVSPQGGRSASPLTIRADADGMLMATLTIPSEALGPGKYIVEATGLSTCHTTQFAYTVR